MSDSLFEAVIGLECHVQLATASKLFSGSANRFGDSPNSLTDPVVLGLPGALPVPNRAAIFAAVRMGLATESRIRPVSRFARKHYFYPDLPKGYQISQYDEPICEGGRVRFSVAGAAYDVRLNRIHLEEDAGKSLHVQGTRLSRVDLNRAGVPLIEIVSEPDLRSPAEAAEYMRTLRQLVRWLGISDGNMEEGSLRCDANVSIRKRGDSALGTKAELKNINSFRFVERAITHEIARQTSILQSGGRIVQETRLWDADAGTSHSMRSKEEAHDYRYFPDPDLPPIVLSEDELATVRAQLPELPAPRARRLQQELGLEPAQTAFLMQERELADWFETAARSTADPGKTAPKLAAWIQTELQSQLNRDNVTLAQIRITPHALGALVDLIETGVISGKIAKDVFQTMWTTGQDPRTIVKEQGLEQVSDSGALEALVRQVLDANPGQTAQYLAGKTGIFGYLVGQVMKASQGKANPAATNELLRKLLGGPAD